MEENQKCDQVSPEMQQYLEDRKKKPGRVAAAKPELNIPEGVSPAMRELLIDRHNKK